MLDRLPRLLLSLALLAYSVLGIAAPGEQINLPDLGDESLAVIPPAAERKLGEQFMREARRYLRIVDDPELSEYIQQLGQRLVAQSDGAYKDFYFFVIDDPSINAFAVPGGFVGVHTGLILNSQSESELASVLAHETAHVTQRHIPRMISEQQRTTLPAMAALLASILLASAAGGQVGEAGIALTTAAMAQKGINFTRSFEEEADRIGMQILARTGFDPRAMPTFFERLQNANRYNETSLPEFLRTHPVTTNRIADSRNRAEQFPLKPVADSREFQHARAKIRAIAPGNPSDIVAGFQDNLEQRRYQDADAEHYGYALALLRAKDLAGARAEMAKLVSRYPQRPYYRMAQAEIEMVAGKYDDALALYADTHRKNPGSVPVARQYAAALLRTGNAARAYEILKPVVRQRPNDPALQKMTASAAGDSGHRVEAHQAQAEYHYLVGNLPAAIEQLKLASKFAGDNFYVQSSIEARSRAIREEFSMLQGK